MFTRLCHSAPLVLLLFPSSHQHLLLVQCRAFPLTRPRLPPLVGLRYANALIDLSAITSKSLAMTITSQGLETTITSLSLDGHDFLVGLRYANALTDLSAITSESLATTITSNGSATYKQADCLPGRGIKFQRKSGGIASARLCERRVE